MHTLGDTEQQENELSRRNEKVTNAVTRRVRQSEMRQRDGNDVDWSVCLPSSALHGTSWSHQAATGEIRCAVGT